MKMTWFSDKLGKKFIFKPAGYRPVSFLKWQDKPVKVIGFHGEPDKNLTYYTVQDAHGVLIKAYEYELTVEADNPITPNEIAAVNLGIINGMKTWIDDMVRDIDPLTSLMDKRFIRGYMMALEGMKHHIMAMEEKRDKAISKDKLDGQGLPIV